MMQKGRARGGRRRNISCEKNAAEEVKVGLRHKVVCPNVTGSTKKRIAESKRACGSTLCFPEHYL